FLFHAPPTPATYTLSLHDALPIFARAAGEPMLAPAAVEVVTGVGIVGDRYATRRGHWSDPRWRDQQLTLVGQELLDELGLAPDRSEEHTSELQSRENLVCRLLLEK